MSQGFEEGAKPRKRMSRLEALRQASLLGVNHPDPVLRALFQAAKEAGWQLPFEALPNEDNEPQKPRITLDPDIVADVFIVAGHIIESGFSKYPDYRREMLIQLGKKCEPYFKLAYNQVREFAEVQDLKWKLTSRAEVERYEEEMDQTS
jgi:hypothetical protein